LKVEGKKVVVIGLGVSGQAAATLLARRGARVFGSDIAEEPMTTEQLAALEAHGVACETGGHTPTVLDGADLVVLSPGVDPSAGPAAAALERGLPVVSEIEAASWYHEGSIVGITGSNGKSTTTAMAAEMLSAGGVKAVPGGNLGRPFAAIVEEEHNLEVIVLELSSFQLEQVSDFHTETAVLLNITPDHLDRYPDMDAYIEAKARLWECQQEGDWAIYGADDPATSRLANRARGVPIPFTLGERPGTFGAWVEERDGRRVGMASLPEDGEDVELFTPEDVPIKGQHNFLNALAAACVARRYGVAPLEIRRALSRFQGLAHRLQLAGTMGEVRFYDDSKATNVESAAAALTGFERDVVLIAGGKHKGSSYTPLRAGLEKCGKAVVLIGEAVPHLRDDLAGVVPIHEAETLEEAVEQAWELAQPGGYVLLAPACSSFDMFDSYRHRGEVFQTAVQRIITRESGLE
jgi:UDP-N-acetylmuramoylalanine--D-glutamate ligase